MEESDAGPRVSGYRVIKKLSTTARGAIKLSHRFGDSLVCVRYRVDAEGRYRYTTVELIVDKNRIRSAANATVSVRAWLFEDSLRSRLTAAGAVWDARARLWRMPRRVAVGMGLEDRIILG